MVLPMMRAKNPSLGSWPHFCCKNKEPFIVGGDFNIMRFISDKNKRSIPSRFSGILNIIINSNDVRKIHILGGADFTWSNNHNNPTLEKLDRVFMSREWELIFPSVIICKRPRELSNHNPLILSTQQNQPRHNREFRFELTWLTHPNFLPKVQEIWDTLTRHKKVLDRVMYKMRKVKQYLKGWGFNLSGSRRKRKHESKIYSWSLKILKKLVFYLWIN
jgi:hypothetical protein